ncbi:hypothetical protein ACH4ZU_16905 [Streptomyces sp. NPDC020472]|uniref:hypothetical protein n=1 Tax=Streptomyces sp. NPDC020472 TaxID=3365075 RepID=UPI0037B24B9D
MNEPPSGQEPRPDPYQQPWGQGSQQPRTGADRQYPPVGGAPYGAAPPRRKRRKWPWVLLGLVLLAAGGCAAVIAVISHEVSKEVTVEYAVTGDARDVTIAYSFWNDDGISSRSETVKKLPWRKTVKTKGFTKGGSLLISLSGSGGTATCSVTVDNDPPKTSTASGPSAAATCSGF